MTVDNNLLNHNGYNNPADTTCTGVSTPKTVAEWFNPGCFAAPAPYTFGNSGVDHVRGSGIDNWDFSLAKDTALGSEKRLLRFAQLCYPAIADVEVNDWLIQDPRPDWVNKPKPADRDDISFGCGLIFLYYLQTQLHLWMPDFLQEGGAAWPTITTG